MEINRRSGQIPEPKAEKVSNFVTKIEALIPRAGEEE